jgi:hypothetical protein
LPYLQTYVHPGWPGVVRHLLKRRKEAGHILMEREEGRQVAKEPEGQTRALTPSSKALVR